MTTIAAIQGENWAAIGYDSRLTEDNSKIYTLPKDNGKVNKNGPYLIGAAGDMRAINILTHVFKPPAVNPNLYGAKLDKFISSVFIQDMKHCFEENSYSKDGEHDSQVIIAVNGTIYEIGDDYSWAHDETGVYAIGSGGGYAMGAMLASLDNKKKTLGTAKNVIRQAITIAAKLDPSTGLPINIAVQHFGS